MTRYNTPPMVNAPSPENLLSFDDMQLLKEHYSLVASACEGKIDWPTKQLNKVFSVDGRAKVADLYSMLQSAGYCIDKIDKDNNLVFKQMRKSKLQMKVESFMSDLPGQPNKKQIAEMQQQCRTRFNGLFETI